MDNDDDDSDSLDDDSIDDVDPFIVSWLRTQDAMHFPRRVRRLGRVSAAERMFTGGVRFFPAGRVTWAALDELRWTYVNGQCLATVVLALLIIEHLLTGALRGAGIEVSENRRLHELLDAAERQGFLQTADKRDVAELNRRRNQYVHGSEEFRGAALIRRVGPGPRGIETAAAQDAEFAIDLLFRLTNKPPFRYETADDE